MNHPEEITPEHAERLVALLGMMGDLDRDGLAFLVGHMASKNIDLAIEAFGALMATQLPVEDWLPRLPPTAPWFKPTVGRHPAIIVETLFSTEYPHAIRVVILRDKNILRGTAAGGSLMCRTSWGERTARVDDPACGATRAGPSRTAALNGESMAGSPLTGSARVAWSAGQAIFRSLASRPDFRSRSRWVMGRLAWDHATVRKNRSWLSPVWNLGCRAE